MPTYTVSRSITTDELDALYKLVKEKGVTMSALLAKAVGMTLAKHPLVNAAYAPDAIAYNPAVNVAMAVAMPDGGLITPVLKDADKTDLYSMGRSWKDLVKRAQASAHTHKFSDKFSDKFLIPALFSHTSSQTSFLIPALSRPRVLSHAAHHSSYQSPDASPQRGDFSYPSSDPSL